MLRWPRSHPDTWSLGRFHYTQGLILCDLHRLEEARSELETYDLSRRTSGPSAMLTGWAASKLVEIASRLRTSRNHGAQARKGRDQ